MKAAEVVHCGENALAVPLGPAIYANGQVRPRHRGATHAGACVVAGSAILALLTLGGSSAVWPLLVFLCGKLSCYAASTFYHWSHATASCERKRQVALSLDWVCIEISILSTGIPFAGMRREAYYVVSVALLLLVVCSALKSSVVLKDACIFVQIVFTVCFIGVETRWSGTWALASAFVFVGLTCFLPVACTRGSRQEAVAAPWHCRGEYGWHEDFHAMVVAGDVCYFTAAVAHVCSRF